MCGNTNQKRKLLKKHQIKESEEQEEFEDIEERL